MDKIVDDDSPTSSASQEDNEPVLSGSPTGTSDVQSQTQTSSQGASCVDGTEHLREPNKAKPYLGDCQVVPRPEVNSRWMLTPPVPQGEYDSYNAVGGFANNARLNTQLSDHVRPLPSFLTGGTSNFLSSGALDLSNDDSFRSDFALGAREPYLPLYGQVDFGLNTSVPGNQNLHSGMTVSHLAYGSLMGVAGPQLTPPVSGLQRYSSPSDNASRVVSEQQTTNSAWKANSRQTSLGNMAHADVGSSGLPAPPIAIRSNGADNRHVSEAESRRTSQYALGTGRSNPFNSSGDRVVSGANRDVDNTHTGAALLSAGSRGTRLVASGNEHSNLEPVGAEAPLISANTGGSMLNRDFGTDSVESTDNSLLALEQRVEEACALVERVLREREEREQFRREKEKRKQQEIREERARSRWPQQQVPITGHSQWLCEHYQRCCRVRFPCCTYFYPCHRCHNNSKACHNEQAKASHATHLKCSFCQHEQEITEGSQTCSSCGTKLSEYFCFKCKHFTGVDKKPFHCNKCGICRIYRNSSFHCDVCNVCLDKKLKGKHKCRPVSQQDKRHICLQENQGQEGQDPLEDQRELQIKRIVGTVPGDGHGVDSSNEIRNDLSARLDDTYRHFNTAVGTNVPPEPSVVDEAHVQGIDPLFLARHSQDPHLFEQSPQASMENTAGPNMVSSSEEPVSRRWIRNPCLVPTENDCICCKDVFSGSLILPCSHHIHMECIVDMIRNWQFTCPICGRPFLWRD